MNPIKLANLIAVSCVLLATAESSFAYIADVQTTVSNTTVFPATQSNRLYIAVGNTASTNLAPVTNVVWLVADTAHNGVPTSPTPSTILGPDDFLIWEDIVDGNLTFNNDGRYRQSIPNVNDAFAAADIYFYLWNHLQAVTPDAIQEYFPQAGDTFGTFNIGTVALPSGGGNPIWNITLDVFATQSPVVPEPSSCALFGAGLGIWAILRRRMRR